MMNVLKSFFTKNIGLKVLSLILGIVIWAALSNRYDPVTTKTLNIPVTYLNEDKLLKDQNYFVMSKPDTVQITVSTRTSKKAKALPELFTCTADLCDHNGGDLSSQRVHINVTQVSGFDTVLDWSYSKNDPNITVSMEDYIEKLFTIEIMPEDSLTEGMIVENDISFSPNVVKVSGPRSKFSNLASVKAVVNYRALSEGGGGLIEEEVQLYLYDANDNVISNSDGLLSMNSEKATMSATIARIQTVSIIVGGTVGTPAAGYRYVSSKAEPSSISVHGLKVSVADLTELPIPAEMIDIEGIAGDRDYVIDILPLLPEGVSLGEGDGKITVHITVEHLESESYSVKASSVLLEGTKKEFNYSVSEGQLSVRVKGFREDLDVLSAESLTIRADVSGLAETGIYRIPVYVDDITGYTVENSGTIYISVSVSENEAHSSGEGDTEDDATDEPGEKNTDTSDKDPEESSAEDRSEEESSAEEEGTP